MNLDVANKIKNRRKELGLTQKELAEGICTQSQISNIEKGELNPSSYVLFKISKRLIVDMNYFFGIDSEIINNQFDEIKDMIEQQKGQRNYTSLRYIVNKELQERKGNLNSYEHRYLLWHRGITDYVLDNEFEKTISFMHDLIIESESNKDLLLNINIKTSIATMYKDEQHFEDAYNLFVETLNELKLIDFKSKYYSELKVLFGLAQTLTYLEKYDESKNYCLQAISICVKEQSLFFLANCYYQLGFNLVNLERKDEGKRYIKISLTLFEIQENTKMVTILNEKINELNK